MDEQDSIIRDLKDELEAEFCPPLDTSLFAAIFNEFEYSPDAVVALRNTLSELAAGTFAEGPTTSQIASNSGIDTSSDSMLLSAYNSSSEAIESPLAFLRAAFPDLAIQLLQGAVDNASNQKTSFNMEKIVEDLLSSELVAQLDSDMMDANNRRAKTKGDRAIATAGTTTQKKIKSTRKLERIVLGDVRQRQLITSPSRGRTEQVDPWTQLSSIAEYLSTLLRCPASVFLSAFHSPDHPTAFHAVASYIDSAPPSGLPEEAVDRQLISMSEMMSTGVEPEEWDAQLARKCIHITNARLSDAIDLYEIVMNLEEPGPINHLPAPVHVASGSTLMTPTFPSTPKLASPVQMKFRSHINKYPAPKPENVSEWSIVKKRTPKPFDLHPHAEFIPAYRNLKAVPAWTIKKAADDVRLNRDIEQSWQERRIEALRKASQHWQRSQGGFGHQVAGFYAEEANKYLRESRAAAVEAARALVVRNRAQSKNLGYNTHNSVDLHGMRREEAIFIVKETLATRAALQDVAQREEPLRFITGKGNHSAGKKSILLPALQNTLKSEGWNFREIEAGLVVYGKR